MSLYRIARVLTSAAAVLPLTGCYVMQAASGQMAIAAKREPIAEVLADASTPPQLRDRLEYVTAARDFASRELGLPDNESYRSYADLGRPYVVWNVFAAPEFSVAPKRWCFPIAGCVSYRGYFDEARALEEAGRLRARGYDVHTGPSIAYSTLGHLRDPVLNTMLGYGDSELAAFIFHELAHQAVYVQDDSDFNEAFATVVEVEGLRRWLAGEGRPEDLDRYTALRRRQRESAALMAEARRRLAALYARRLPPAETRAEKTAEFGRLRDALVAGGHPAAGEFNNARLVALATYERCVPALQAELARLGDDLRAFYAAMKLLEDDAAARVRLCPPP
jgi:predicted aminopeptidase